MSRLMFNAARRVTHASRLTPHTSRAFHASRLTLIIALCVMMTACGFHLRGNVDLPFQTLYIDAPPGSLFGNDLQRAIVHSTTTTVTGAGKDAQAIVHILSEDRSTEILSLSTAGRVQELSLYYRVTFQVTDGENDKEYAPKTTLTVRQDITYSDTEIIAIGQEEDLLYRDMQKDATQQLMRRLQAIHPTHAQPIAPPATH